MIAGEYLTWMSRCLLLRSSSFSIEVSMDSPQNSYFLELGGELWSPQSIRIPWWSPYFRPFRSTDEAQTKSWEPSISGWLRWSPSTPIKMASLLGCHWPFQEPKLEVPTICKAYFLGLCKGISPEKHGYIVKYLHFRILKFLLNMMSWR